MGRLAVAYRHDPVPIADVSRTCPTRAICRATWSTQTPWANDAGRKPVWRGAAEREADERRADACLLLGAAGAFAWMHLHIR